MKGRWFIFLVVVIITAILIIWRYQVAKKDMVETIKTAVTQIIETGSKTPKTPLKEHSVIPVKEEDISIMSEEQQIDSTPESEELPQAEVPMPQE